MLIRKQLFSWFTLLVVFCIITTVLAKRHRHDDDDDDDDDDYDYDDDDDFDEKDNVPGEKPEIQTPRNTEWLKSIDLSGIKGRVRPVGSGICKNAKCDGTDNDECFETCGNQATPDDIYGCPANRTWSLTFDDGPSNVTMALLDMLDKTNVKVTFCVMGAHAKEYPEIIKRAYEAGHQIASHTYSHPHLMSLTNEEIVYEVKATEEAIIQAIGVKPRYLRPPYGEADARVKSILKRMGYKVLMWNVDPTDYNVHMLKDGDKRILSAFEKIANGSVSYLNAHNDPGYISLQHDLYQVSMNQVPTVIAKLKQKGYRFMTAAECVGDKEPHSSKDVTIAPVKDEEEIKKPKEEHDDDDNDDDDDDDDYEQDSAKVVNKKVGTDGTLQVETDKPQEKVVESSSVRLTVSLGTFFTVFVALYQHFF